MNKTSWICELRSMLEVATVSNFLKGEHLDALHSTGKTPKQAFQTIRLMIVDTASGQISAIYPISERNKFSKLAKLRDYEERLAPADDVRNNPNQVARSASSRPVDFIC